MNWGQALGPGVPRHWEVEESALETKKSKPLRREENCETVMFLSHVKDLYQGGGMVISVDSVKWRLMRVLWLEFSWLISLAKNNSCHLHSEAKMLFQSYKLCHLLSLRDFRIKARLLHRAYKAQADPGSFIFLCHTLHKPLWTSWVIWSYFSHSLNMSFETFFPSSSNCSSSFR